LRNLALKRRRQAFKRAPRGNLGGVQQRYRKLFFHNGKFDDDERKFVEAGLNAKKRIDSQPNCCRKYTHIQFWNSKNDSSIKRLMMQLASSQYYAYDSDNCYGKLSMTSDQWNAWRKSG